MDSERLGWVLGAGARGAARTLLSAADAASAVNPRAPRSPAGSPAPSATVPSRSAASSGGGAPVPPTAASAGKPSRPSVSPASGRALAEGSRRFGVAVASPVRRLSKVLWLEFTGVFFGLFALSAAVGAWRLRNSFRHPAAGDPARAHLLLALGIAIVFTYFCVSSFVRAARRGRQI